MKHLLLAIGTIMTFTFCNSTRDISTTTVDISETILTEQLQKVINLIPTGFESLKYKQLTRKLSTTPYSSTFTLHGTYDNQVGDLSGRPCYRGKIAEMKTEEEATLLVKRWITKVGASMHNLETKKVPYRTGGTQSELVDGTYFFLNDSHGVSVCWSEDPDSEIFNIIISVV